MLPNPPPTPPGKFTPSNRPNQQQVDPETKSQGIPKPSDSELPGMPPMSRTAIAAYSRTLRGCDQAVLDEFKNLYVWRPDQTNAGHVPIVWGPQEKAVAIALNPAVDKETIRIDRIKVPILGLAGGDIEFDPARFTYHKAFRWFHKGMDGASPYVYGNEKRFGDTVFGKSRGLPVNKRYTLYAWTRYTEDMNQVLEQIMLKFAPILTLEVPDVHWEVVLKLDSVSNGISQEIGDAAIRILKYQFGLTAETYISRGYIRGKTLFDMKTEIGLCEGDDFQVTDRLEDSVTDGELDDLPYEV